MFSGRLRLVLSTPVEFTVCPESRSFHVHEAVLDGCQAFQKMLEPGKFKEGQVKDLYPINLSEIHALASIISCSPKVDKDMRGFLRSKVRERKIDLWKEPQWREIVEAGVETGLTWEVITALSS